jgi:hypothetical protein
MTANLLIDDTVIEIGKWYRPGLLMWLKRQPDQWTRLLTLESEINRASLQEDQDILLAALTEYKGFFREMMEVYRKSETLPLFGGRANG